MDQVTAVFLDTVSIQKYVFASNSLKENLGASFLVESIYKEYLQDALEEVYGEMVDDEAWKNDSNTIVLEKDKDRVCEIGYIGGGNALLLFRNEEQARLFVKKWTLRLLTEAPGIQTGVAMAPFSLDPEDYRENMELLVKRLDHSKNTNFPNTVLAKHGITADCLYSEYSAEAFFHNPDGKDTYISSVSKAKRLAAEEMGKRAKNEYKDIIDKGFAFSVNHEQLGQKEGNNYLAIVHIDGNAMGKRFMECRTLAETRRLSCAVDSASKNAYAKLLKSLAGSIAYLEKHPEYEISKDEKERKILPLRSIVLGGDDITFVTDGRLGVYLAKKYLELLEKEPLPVLKGQKPIYACAGVAVIKSRYPFYRGYQIAEELCHSAKKAAAQNPDSSWLDFYISQGGYSQNLSGIREKHYRVLAGNLNFGPYLVSDNRTGSEKAISNLIKGMNEFRNIWPRSKVKDLRQILPMGMEANRKHLESLNARNLALPEIDSPSNYSEAGWNNEITPYFEMIELMEFYPEDDFLSKEAAR